MSDGYVYFFHAPAVDAVKIGWSADPRRRLAQIQACSPTPVRLVFAVAGTEYDERKLHERFAGWRLHGEWFEAHAIAELLSLEAYVAEPLGRLFTVEQLHDLVSDTRKVAA